MARSANTNRNGGNWTESEKKEIWKEGETISGYSPDERRQDKCGKTMKWSEHGNRSSNFGWEIDHIDPVSNGGGDEIGNLQPLHWENNADKADKLSWTCPK